ncbi:hypothetical protein ACIPW5_37990 [Streptomyces sp. NPDC090077]|uniref:hypothetical protein n=1 Tax=Streptomyces sp. NPDC090077 TaxID=3365938 RepID=UPI00382E7C41
MSGPLAPQQRTAADRARSAVPCERQNRTSGDSAAAEAASTRPDAGSATTRASGTSAFRHLPRVFEKRTRQAVDRLVTLQFDRHGGRLWDEAKALPDHEHTRMRIGQVAVPFGICAEPSNVKAGGHACPFRFRCLGCDHFGTDPSYLPDLRAYLDTLLRDRERLAAADELDAWARAEATPSEEEISRLRRLIRRVESDLDTLTDEEREEIRQATSALRRSCAVRLGMPTLRPAASGLRLGREA